MADSDVKMQQVISDVADTKRMIQLMLAAMYGCGTQLIKPGALTAEEVLELTLLVNRK